MNYIPPISSTPSPIETSWQWVKKNSDLVSSVGLLALNTLVLLAKAFSIVPDHIGYAGQAGLSYVGITACPWMWGNLDKQIIDVNEGLAARDWVGLAFSSVSTLNQSNNIILTVAGAVASVLSVVGKRSIALSMYSHMMPIAIAGLVASVALDLFSHFDSVALLAQLKSIPKMERRAIEEICQRGQSEAPARYRSIRPRIVRSMQMDGWRALQGERADSGAVWTTLVGHTESKIESTRNQLGNRAIGHFSMALCKLMPETVAEKAVLWFSSASYTANLAYQKDMDNRVVQELLG